jgi:hypothetical protein
MAASEEAGTPMNQIKVTGEYGIILRRQALAEKDIALRLVLAAMEVAEPLDGNGDLLAFGPCFGAEAQGVLTRRLIELGLAYFDDFVALTADVPFWCALHASLKNP